MCKVIFTYYWLISCLYNFEAKACTVRFRHRWICRSASWTLNIGSGTSSPSSSRASRNLTRWLWAPWTWGYGSRTLDLWLFNDEGEKRGCSKYWWEGSGGQRSLCKVGESWRNESLFKYRKTESVIQEAITWINSWSSLLGNLVLVLAQKIWQNSKGRAIFWPKGAVVMLVKGCLWLVDIDNDDIDNLGELT